MAELNSLECAQCGRTVERTHWNQTLCKDSECRKERVRKQASTNYHLRTSEDTSITKLGVTLTCGFCGRTCPKTSNTQRFCRDEDCKKDRAKARWQKWAAKDGSRELINEYQRRYRKETHYGRKWEVKKKYGLEWDEYLALLDEYNHTCALCDESDDIVVDHCHVTGKVRGILCRKHNAGIGSLDDNAAGVYKAYQYLLERESREG